jgi:hypothetical protein
MRYVGKARGATLLVAAILAGLIVTQLTVEARVSSSVLQGVVTSSNGPEAGVWVVAETTDLPTRLVKIVVTDDQGRYLIPDLPQAQYAVWVRGYGLVDSPRVGATPGSELNLTAVPAPDARAAAQYYPAGYWFSMLRPPDSSEFPGTGDAGNGISANMQSQAQWIRQMKTGACDGCHGLGNAATRQLEPQLGQFDSSADAWQRRISSGQAGPDMLNAMNGFGMQRGLGMFADWTDRIAAGEIPTSAPSRPQGLERNIVLTEWDWADETGYLHDEVSTDRRNPTVNGNGLIYGSMELSTDYLPVLDPVHNTITRVDLHIADPDTPPAATQSEPAPSPYFGDQLNWTGRANVHNAMFDKDGRVWFTSTVRPSQDPDYCGPDSSMPAAQAFPLTTSNRQLGMYDPKTGQQVAINTCFGTHHLMFAEDANNTLWTSGGGQVVGWLDTKKFLETGDAAASQGWTPIVLDTVGDGVRHAYTEPNEPTDPGLDQRINAPAYAISPAPDGTVWTSCWQCPFPGAIVRINPGPNPVETALAEIYQPPWNNPNAPNVGYGPRGMDIDRDGVVWMAMASGHMASFDRRKCQGPLNGPTATGQQCPEGWTFYAEPLPQLQGVDQPGSAEGSYYTWVDQFNSLGLGNNVPINTGNESEGLLVLNQGQWVVLRVPYPMGFYAKWLDGRIDDPNAGWKGRGLWASVSTRAPFHMETGKGTTSKVIHFQLRPDPLTE